MKLLSKNRIIPFFFSLMLAFTGLSGLTTTVHANDINQSNTMNQPEYAESRIQIPNLLSIEAFRYSNKVQVVLDNIGVDSIDFVDVYVTFYNNGKVVSNQNQSVSHLGVFFAEYLNFNNNYSFDSATVYVIAHENNQVKQEWLYL